MRLYDAHNHLQDERLHARLSDIMAQVHQRGLTKAVCNGTQPSDWERVAQIASKYPNVLPCFGLHPWFVRDVPADWQEQLESRLDSQPSAIGEIGLDRWMKDYDWNRQVEVFQHQLHVAQRRNLPVMIHCLKAWGPLVEMLRATPLPSGFLVHSYSGSAETARELLALGGWFSISLYFAHDRKAAQREVFRTLPLVRLLLETDAPDMRGPEELEVERLPDDSNHPGNILAVYQFAARLFGCDLNEFTSRIEQNFHSFFRLDAPTA